jgi:hypothetical protein
MERTRMYKWKPGASFRPDDIKGAGFLGLILGLGAFWNGALIIAALLILGTAILWAPKRGDLLLCCAIAAVLAMLEARFFIRTGPTIAPKLHIGFLAPAATIGSIATYYVLLLGLLVPLLAIAFWMLTRQGRWLLASVLVPIIFATTFTFTPDVTVNHKFVNVSVRVASIFVALLIVRLFDSGRRGRIAAGVLCLALTATGMIDLVTLWNLNDEKRTHDLGDPMLQWAIHETDPKAVFAAPPVYHHLVYFTGRQSYLGLPYWAESAGYDAARRKALLSRIYESGSHDEVQRIASSEGISYVIVDDAARAQYPHLSETVFKEGFPVAFSRGSTQVYALRP